MVPLSTISNWKREFAKWAPGLELLVYQGTKKEREQLWPRIKGQRFHVLLTSFNLVMNAHDVTALSAGKNRMLFCQ